MDFIVYELATGMILTTGTSQDQQPYNPDTEGYLTGEFGILSYRKHYISNGQVIDRPVLDIPEMLMVYTDDSYTIDVPVGCLVQVDDGPEIVVEDDHINISSDIPADYELTIKAWPYQTKQVKVKINAA